MYLMNKVDMDDSLKENSNVLKLEKEIQLRLDHPHVKMKDIFV